LLRRTLNLGILAHVDAGKTTLTERLLHAAGVIDEVGSVDDGTTQTDTLPLERQRGITIKSAVVSFTVDDVVVNLIDTPGHPDFIAEVERVLSVLDGAVLVISAVEGVQPHTVLLMRALARLQVPTLLFVNKIDRRGAGYDRVLQAIHDRLTPRVVAMGSVHGLGTRAAGFKPWDVADAGFAARLADLLAADDDALLAAYVDGKLSAARLREELGAQTARGQAHPVFFGSALTGAGVVSIMAGIAELLPATAGEADAPVSGTVFKIERGPAGEKVAYVRMFSGTVRTRDRLQFGEDGEQKVTAISVFDRGATDRRAAVSAGEIAKLWGLPDVQIGDTIGAGRGNAEHHFAPPTLESAVAPRRPEDGGQLRAALGELAEQDPLIHVRQDDRLQEISVSLYGEVQQEVIGATLASDYGLEVRFREATPLYVERPIGRGEAVEVLHADTNPYFATIGLRVDRAPIGSGVEFRLDVPARSAPLYVYKRLPDFREAMGQYVREALQEGLRGWQVTDCLVTMTRCAYSVADGPPSRRGPTSTAADFRKLTPLVLGQALERAGTVVCEPIVRAALEVPTEAIGALLPAVAHIGAAVEPPSSGERLSTIGVVLPAARLHELQRQLPVRTGGEGVLESSFAGYRPVTGEQPTRRPHPSRPSEPSRAS
jgi:ribosomal protection tetracycline resistance protein